ncbi:hypothetical protein J3458_005312 [Metarhizium acridum]|uniref:uncharacterized protein n=1 Tax=Metarhizium acridum TaxID=92637 RepID=UPI001C6AE935|nr:hypothetical protein J3458_005312 [Metarhizium acridum]
MDYSLLCNNLKCRRELRDRALVTTCSHAFCLDCVQHLRLVCDIAAKQTFVCPACHSTLFRDRETGIANLLPSEDHKAIVLSGLSPGIVLECAERALNFWAYQKTQEICYQQHVYGILTEKHLKLKSQFHQTVTEANAEIARLQTIIDSTTKEHERVCRRNEELVVAHRDKSRRLLQVQELYHKAKAGSGNGNPPRTVGNAVDSTPQFHWQTHGRNWSDTRPEKDSYHWPLVGERLNPEVVVTKSRRHLNCSSQERPVHHMALTRQSTLSRRG